MERSGATTRLSWVVILSIAACALAAAPAIGDTKRAGERSPAVDLEWIRAEFYTAVDDEQVAAQLQTEIEETFGEDWSTYNPSIAAYYAAIEGLRGKHTRALGQKLRHVNRAIDLFNELVRLNPGNFEVRFLRYSFYEQIPALFGVRHLVGEDLRVVIELLESGQTGDVPATVLRDSIGYLLESEFPSGSDRGVLLELLSQLPATSSGYSAR